MIISTSFCNASSKIKCGLQLNETHTHSVPILDYSETMTIFFEYQSMMDNLEQIHFKSKYIREIKCWTGKKRMNMNENNIFDLLHYFLREENKESHSLRCIIWSIFDNLFNEILLNMRPYEFNIAVTYIWNEIILSNILQTCLRFV